VSADHRKRPAFESPARLAQRPAADPHMKRPASTIAGGLLVFLRVAAGVLWLLALTANWPELIHQLEVEIDEVLLAPDELAPALMVIWVIAGVLLAIDAVLGVLILLGFNTPRVVVMLFAVVSTIGSFTAWMATGQEIHIDTTLLTVALDILILLALSSRSAAAYARRNEVR